MVISNCPNMCVDYFASDDYFAAILNNKKYVIFGDAIYTIYFQPPLRKSHYLKVTMYRTTIQRYNIKKTNFIAYIKNVKQLRWYNFLWLSVEDVKYEKLSIWIGFQMVSFAIVLQLRNKWYKHVDLNIL